MKLKHLWALRLTLTCVLMGTVSVACSPQEKPAPDLAPAEPAGDTSTPEQEPSEALDAKPEASTGGSGDAQYAQTPPPSTKKISYSPYPERDFPQNVYFGDTHLHTSFSTDAGMIGNTLGPDAAYRFAKGERVTSSTGVEAKLERPLDFLVVADHAESIGAAPAIANGDAVILETEFGRQLYELVESGQPDKAYDMWLEAGQKQQNPLAGEMRLIGPAWKAMTAAAEAANQPGLFSAFIGFEFTTHPDGKNLHRVVVFRDGKARADQVVPFSRDDSEDPEDLWAYMQAYEEKTGGQVLAIPHNGNLSNGLMFDDVTLTSQKPLDASYAEARMRWEPLYEVTQMKGDGETHPSLSPDDEFADFETWDKSSFGAEPKTPDMLPREYAREAYKRGLEYEETVGTNPFKFGMIGSTDSHTSLSTTQEDNFFGKVVLLEPSADPLRFQEVIAGRPAPEGSQHFAWETGASGLAAVWAVDNTREAIWDAMRRKEVYATTGGRMRVRVFAGWEFAPDDLSRSNFAEYGYANGVPMGADLSSAPKRRSPTFLIRAVRDPNGANLDRVQVIKGWLDSRGKTHERIYDVAVSDGRAIGPNGRAKKPVGNTVDQKSASYTNSIGDPFLEAYWQDPNFDPKQRAFYYVRVIEIPTPRWTTYDAKIFGVELPEGAPVSIQDRAYTSPIWYTP
jgi:hypothetical protein